MLNNKNIQEKVIELGLSSDEAKIYLELLKKPNTHLQLSRITGVERAKIYRIAQDLEKRSLITRRTDDRGTFLVATDPKTLEIDLIAQEEKLKEKRNTLAELLPSLSSLPTQETSGFVINTYEGEEGIKQQLWHELAIKTEMLIFGGGILEDLVNDRQWVEKHRENTIKAGYRIRELLNRNNPVVTTHTQYFSLYSSHYIPEKLLHLDNPVIIYDDTVSIIHRNHEQQVGVEIINSPLASLMRQMFENYWEMSKPFQNK